MTIDDLGFLLDNGTRLGVVLVTVVVAVRVLNHTYTSAMNSWEATAATLQRSADYATAETKRLRERVARLETEAHAYHAERAEWLIERGGLLNRIGTLETTVERLTHELDVHQEDTNHD